MAALPPGKDVGRSVPEKGEVLRCARMRFAYDKRGVRLISCRTFLKVAPAGERKLLTRGSAGSWLESRDQHDQPVWVRQLGPCLGFDVELHGGPKGNIVRVPNESARGEITVIVPILPGAQKAILFTPPLRPNAAHLPAEPRLILAWDHSKETWRELDRERD